MTSTTPNFSADQGKAFAPAADATPVAAPAAEANPHAAAAAARGLSVEQYIRGYDMKGMG